MKKLTLSLYTAAATLLAMAVSAPALSQGLTLEEIIVTATKRAEGLRVGAIPFLQRFAVCRNSVHVKMLPTRACGRADDAYV